MAPCHEASAENYERLRSRFSADSKTITGICNSILSTGYHVEETVVSRDTSRGITKLRYGNGMKRGLAVKLVRLGICISSIAACSRWVLLRKSIQDGLVQKDEEALNVFTSMCAIPTLFEGQPDDGGDSSDLIQQAVRQNVQGTYIQPLTSLQWVHLCLLSHFGVAEAETW